MIEAAQVMPLLLEACPSFATTWSVIEQENLWHEDQDDDIADASKTDRLYFDDAEAFVRHMVDLRLDGATGEFPAVFRVIERFLVEGNKDVKNLGLIGYLEGMQMGTVTSKSLDPDAEFLPYLLPVSRRWWDRLNRFWEGDTSALQVTDP
jgi:hypothetical protein